MAVQLPVLIVFDHDPRPFQISLECPNLLHLSESRGSAAPPRRVFRLSILTKNSGICAILSDSCLRKQHRLIMCCLNTACMRVFVMLLHHLIATTTHFRVTMWPRGPPNQQFRHELAAIRKPPLLSDMDVFGLGKRRMQPVTQKDFGICFKKGERDETEKMRQVVHDCEYVRFWDSNVRDHK